MSEMCVVAMEWFIFYVIERRPGDWSEGILNFAGNNFESEL